MKKILTLILIFGFFFLPLHAQTRYVDEVFSNVTVTSDITYGTNLSVLSGMPVSEELKMDIYEPEGDGVTSRPVVIMVHGGSYLPIAVNAYCTGSKMDLDIVEMSMRLAKRGYVVAAIDFRLGWNPHGDQEVRTQTYLNAFYRSVQDIRNAVRFFRYTFDNGNPYGVANDKFSVIGEGTGALSAVAVGSLSDSTELMMAKYINPVTGSSFIDFSLSGNIEGTNVAPLNLANYPNYLSDVNFIGNLGGVVGDSTWIEAGEPPIVSFHCPNDPFHPYAFGAVIIATTGGFFVNMSGSYDINRISNELGNNDSYINAGIDDALTEIADSRNKGRHGLYPFSRPSTEFAPWQWWDTNNPNNANALLTNPDMSESKAQAYIDTIMGYLTPRMALSNGLIFPAGRNELSNDKIFSVFPNPSNDIIQIQTLEKEYEVEIVTIRGQVLFKDKNVKMIHVHQLAPGTYIVSFKGEKYVGHKNIIVY